MIALNATSEPILMSERRTVKRQVIITALTWTWSFGWVWAIHLWHGIQNLEQMPKSAAMSIGSKRLFGRRGGGWRQMLDRWLHSSRLCFWNPHMMVSRWIVQCVVDWSDAEKVGDQEDETEYCVEETHCRSTSQVPRRIFAKFNAQRGRKFLSKWSQPDSTSAE